MIKLKKIATAIQASILPILVLTIVSACKTTDSIRSKETKDAEAPRREKPAAVARKATQTVTREQLIAALKEDKSGESATSSSIAYALEIFSSEFMRSVNIYSDKCTGRDIEHARTAHQRAGCSTLKKDLKSLGILDLDSADSATLASLLKFADYADENARRNYPDKSYQWDLDRIQEGYAAARYFPDVSKTKGIREKLAAPFGTAVRRTPNQPLESLVIFVHGCDQKFVFSPPNNTAKKKCIELGSRLRPLGLTTIPKQDLDTLLSMPNVSSQLSNKPLISIDNISPQAMNDARAIVRLHSGLRNIREFSSFLSDDTWLTLLTEMISGTTPIGSTECTNADSKAMELFTGIRQDRNRFQGVATNALPNADLDASPGAEFLVRARDGYEDPIDSILQFLKLFSNKCAGYVSAFGGRRAYFTSIANLAPRISTAVKATTSLIKGEKLAKACLKDRTDGETCFQAGLLLIGKRDGDAKACLDAACGLVKKGCSEAKAIEQRIVDNQRKKDSRECAASNARIEYCATSALMRRDLEVIRQIDRDEEEIGITNLAERYHRAMVVKTLKRQDKDSRRQITSLGGKAPDPVECGYDKEGNQSPAAQARFAQELKRNCGE